MEEIKEKVKVQIGKKVEEKQKKKEKRYKEVAFNFLYSSYKYICRFTFL